MSDSSQASGAGSERGIRGSAGAASKGWLRAQAKLARRAAMPTVAAGTLAVLCAIGQSFCAAIILQEALSHRFRDTPLLLVMFTVAAILRALFGVWSERAAAFAGASARRRLRNDAFARLLGAGPALLRRGHSAELAAVAIDRVEALDGFFARWIPASILALAAPALVLLAVLVADPYAAGVLLGAGLLVPVAMAVAGIGAGLASRRQFLAMTRLQARFLDRVRGIATIVLYGRAEDEAVALGVAAAELRRRTMRVLRVAFLSSAALDCAMAFALVWLALHYGSKLLGGGLGSAGPALFVLLLVPEFFAPLRTYAAAYQDGITARTAAEALCQLPPLPPASAPLEVRNVEASGLTVVFEGVGFTWDANRGPALDGLSFRAMAGETLVVAGPSGAGKSTIFEILLGFIRPDRGRVLINGADIASIVPQALARMTAWIGQRPLLFAGTLRENILFARPEASDEEVLEAARRALVSAFAAELPLGLDTVIGEGAYGLSGGQAQRVAIARAFLKNAPLLLLDEPTAHLDPLTEAEVLDSLRRLAIGRTVILASHSAAAHAFGGRRIDLRNGSVTGVRGAA